MNRKQGAGVVSSRKAARAGAGAATPTTLTLSELEKKKTKQTQQNKRPLIPMQNQKDATLLRCPFLYLLQQSFEGFNLFVNITLKPKAT